MIGTTPDNHIIERRARPAIGHMGHLHAGHGLEQFADRCSGVPLPDEAYEYFPGLASAPRCIP